MCHLMRGMVRMATIVGIGGSAQYTASLRMIIHLELRRFNGECWVKVCENSDTTQAICQWATALRLWWTKCQWFKEEDKQKSLVTKQLIRQERHMNSLKSLMKHDRKHKSGGSGIRLDVENFRADKTFTDYECTNNHHRFHDFQKSYV